MDTIIQIDNEVITTDQFIKYLKFSQQYEKLLHEFIKYKVTVHAAIKREIKVADDEIQAAAVKFIKSLGMRRAKEAYDWLESLGVTLEEYEEYLTEQIYKSKVIDTITDDEAIEEYFKLNTPMFDTIDLKRIIVERESRAREIIASLVDEPESIGKLVDKYSLDEKTREYGGRLVGVGRSEFPDVMSAKLFNARPGEILGPFRIGKTAHYQVVVVLEVHTAVLDESIREKISKAIYDDWLNARFIEHSISE